MQPDLHVTCALWYSLKLLFLASKCKYDIIALKNLNSRHLKFYSPIDPQINHHTCRDMTYPPAKFDVDWSKDTKVIVKNTNVCCPDASQT